MGGTHFESMQYATHLQYITAYPGAYEDLPWNDCLATSPDSVVGRLLFGFLWITGDHTHNDRRPCLIFHRDIISRHVVSPDAEYELRGCSTTAGHLVLATPTRHHGDGFPGLGESRFG